MAPVLPLLVLLLLPPAQAMLLPPLVDVAKMARIWATATCGEPDPDSPQQDPGRDEPVRFCQLVSPMYHSKKKTIQDKFCDICNSSNPEKAHPATNAIDGTTRWWQSPPVSMGKKYEQVNLTLDLGQVFLVSNIIIKFANSPRPSYWILERSVDFGHTYTPWQYFAPSRLGCIQAFGTKEDKPHRDNDVLCVTRFSSVLPLENGQIRVSLTLNRPGAKMSNISKTLLEFIQATNIRLRFLEYGSFKGHLMSRGMRDPSLTGRYFYSVMDISMGAWCFCNGHAEKCHRNNPQKRFQCECQHNTCGQTCNICCPGFNQKPWKPGTSQQNNECEACNCHGHASDCSYNPDVEDQHKSLNTQGIYEGGGVCINCQHNTAGVNCEECAKGYYRPHGFQVNDTFGCTPCQCDAEYSDGCEQGSGLCRCKPNFQGDHCEKCAAGYQNFPVCSGIPIFPVSTPSPEETSTRKEKECDCDLQGVLPRICDNQKRCLCRPGVEGPRCDTCSMGFYSFPLCQACQCSPLGSCWMSCNQVTGQCDCLPHLTGRQCDRCLSGAIDFPRCQGLRGSCDLAGTIRFTSGHCQCKDLVEGPNCNVCKPLYWNLAKENPSGCSECRCHEAGTQSQIGECVQRNGNCPCKAHVTSSACDTCSDGYFTLENQNYFGCKGCQCDVGGALDPTCRGPDGVCKCRKHVVGNTCQGADWNYYFPDLHHMKYEIEDGTVPNGKILRFGFDPQEFPGFSWRGYSQMNALQNEVKLTLDVGKADGSLFRIILRYVNPGTEAVAGHITIYPNMTQKGATQSKGITFLPSKQPAFVTIPGNGLAEPFSMTPGTWVALIKAEGVLLDYVVLLPRDYYEASALRPLITKPCASHWVPLENCLDYQHLPVTRFSCTLAEKASTFLRDSKSEPLTLRKPSPIHPLMVDLNGDEVELHLQLSVPQAGRYAILLEYAANNLTVLDVTLSNRSALAGHVHIYSCKYSILCRSAVIDDHRRVAAHELSGDTDIQLRLHGAQLLLHQICVIPIEEFSPEYLRPGLRCIATYRPLVSQGLTCISQTHKTPPRALILNVPNGYLLPSEDEAVLGLTLEAPQHQVMLKGVIPQQGRYVFIAHFYQAAHPSFPVRVSVDGRKQWTGSFQASFCPHVLGCQEEVITQGQVEFDNPKSKMEVTVTVSVPKDKSLVLVRVLVVPAENYNSQVTQYKTFLDQSAEFITSCGENSFYLNPETASRFCRNSARSLVAFYHNGSLPCDCHPAGSIINHCNTMGGQCQCRPNVIGQQCTRCASGYYGFPRCRQCNCGKRLCDETTGQCLCPPNTIQPQCEECEMHFHSFHPRAGCDSCDCSQKGTHISMECSRVTGQCSCKSPGITGRRCDQCASGYYMFPECRPCRCNRSGTQPQVCDKKTQACFCKENVEGAQCDRCQEGSFNLDPANPIGCTSCFCFGVTHRCTKTNGLHVKFSKMDCWRLETADGVTIPVSYNPSSQSMVADIQELPSTVLNVSWVAPSSYLGDKVTSYGGYLTYQIKSFGLPEDMVLLEKAPDVQLTGRHMSIVHEMPNNPQPDQHQKVQVQLLEGNFRHVSSGAPVSREDLMVLLSGLERLSIRGLYFTETQRLTLGWVGLDVLSHNGLEPAPLVEKCTCPPGYMGDSCQSCSPGYYRDYRGLYNGLCLPCNCHGHSNRCQDGSGICINCQHSTAGEHCERCKDGHYGNAARGSCRVCPCPHTNSFATGCVVNGGNVQCACKPGYTGSQCERCAPGYFGNPQKFGGSCQPCHCNGNGQLGTCDPITGDCVSQEPKDSSPANECDDCDSCVMTLLNDLATMGEELHLVKSQLQGLSASSGALEQIQHMETQAKDLRNQLLHYRSAISNHGSKINGLEKELSNLNHEFETLQEKAQINSRKAQTLYNNVDRTIQSTKELDMKIKNVIQNVHILLKQISGTGGGGGGNNLPIGDFSRELAEAERRLTEMRSRHFGKPLQEAEAEEREAQLLLNRIKSWLETHQVGNDGLAKDIQDSLNDYEAKLHELQAMIQEAAAQAKQAAGLNHENERALGAIKRQVKEISSLQSEFTKYLSTADSTLIQTSSMLQLMDKNWKEYENLAATLNEARQELSDKVRELSRSSSQESLVVQAEKHAQSLQELAKQLEEIKRNASGDELVRRAVDAATAYENILNAIQAAEDAANKASSASESALQTVIKEDLPRKAKTLSSDSDKLLNEAKRTQKKLQQEISLALNNLQQTLNIMKVQKELIDTNLTSVRSDLRGIQRGAVDSVISGAKSMVRKASDITSEVLDGLSPIQTDLERIKDNYESAQSEDFNKALTDANKSVKKLTKKLPDLLSKIESINQQLLPLGNISDNVDRIRELIQQARDAANKVAVPMRFNGKSGVEVRLPNDLEDLKGYTSLSLFLQRPDSRENGGTEDMFVMYLGNKNASGDYIGMAVVDGQLSCVYSLGDRVAELSVDQILTKSESQEAVMDRVKFQRIYQFARLNYTEKATSTKPKAPQFYDTHSGSSNTLLNLDPENVVLYVGGYPPDFQLPSKLRFPPYKGCIELDDLNENVLSLYNFKKTFNLNTTEVEPCRRRKEESDKNYFEGTGYARVPTQANAFFPTFGQTIQTTMDRGLLFFAENQDHFISLNVEDGSVMVRYKLDSEPPRDKRIRGTINNGKDHLILIKIGKIQNLMRINVDDQNIRIEGKIFDFSVYYLGGIPIAIRERFNISTPAFRGCMKNLKKTSGVVRLNDTVGVTKKCSEDWQLVRSASFSRGGQLSFTNLHVPPPGHFQASFGFQTFQPSGVLLYYQTRTSSLQVTLEDGHIELSTRESNSPILKSPQTYMDGLLHYISVISDTSGLRLLIDDQPFRKDQRLQSVSNSPQSLHLGGSAFEGCISNVFIQRFMESPEVLDFTNKSTKREVSLGGCSLNKPPFLMLLKGSTRFNKARTFDVNKMLQDAPVASARSMEVWRDPKPCSPPAGAQTSHTALQFGDSPTSHLLFQLPQELQKPRSEFAVDIHTTSSRGLVFYTGTKNSFMALYLLKGHLVFALGAAGKKLRLKSKEKYNDGKWHTVVFGQDGRRGHLRVDGLRAQEGSLPRNSTSSPRAQVYLGWSPSGKPKNLPQNSFVGCLKNFRLGLKPLDSPLTNFGVSPCMNGSLEKGIYFSQEGGHVNLANSVLLGPEFKLMFSIRPRSLTGILIHIGSQRGQHLSVYMEAGKVTASVDSGAGRMSTSVTPKQALCEGQWHSVAVTIKQHILHLELDKENSYTAGQLSFPPHGTQGSLHIGGVPANLKTLNLPVWRSFFGCLKNIQVNQKLVPISEAMEVQGSVRLNGCPEY